MSIVTKASASVTAVPDGPATSTGEFDVILSTAALDRDGDRLHADEWKQPLPDHITFDSDHGMSVATTVGSGRPFINAEGQLQVRGTFASTDHAQNVRRLVNEGHVRSVSVAFMTGKNQKTARVERELLNGAFVAVPANSEAVVLSAKAAPTPLDMPGAQRRKGAPQPGGDAYLNQEHVPDDARGDSDASGQEIHDLAVSLGARCRGSQAHLGLSDGAPTYSKGASDADRHVAGGVLHDSVPADACGASSTENTDAQSVHDAATRLGADCAADHAANAAPSDASGASDAFDAQNGIQAVLQGIKRVEKALARLENGNSAEDATGGDDDDDNYPNLQMLHDAAEQLGDTSADMAIAAQTGQVWGANSPTIAAPKTSAKSATNAAAQWAAAAVADDADDPSIKTKLLTIALAAAES